MGWIFSVYVWVYTYNKYGKKVFLFGNKAKVLNLSLGFAFLDSEVLNISIYHPSDNEFSKCNEIDIIIKLEYNWVLKDYKELKEKPLNEQQRKNEVRNILNHIQNVKNVIEAYRFFNEQGLVSDKAYKKYQAMADNFFKSVYQIHVEVLELQKDYKVKVIGLYWLIVKH